VDDLHEEVRRKLMVRLAVVATTLICLAIAAPAITGEGEQPLSIQGLDWENTQLFMGGMGYGVMYFNTPFSVMASQNFIAFHPGSA
jgi:hypothetical protein